MRTRSYLFGRHWGVGVAVIAVLALAAMPGPPAAGAGQLASERAQAAYLANRIQELGAQEAALGERYDAAVENLSAANARVAAASRAYSAAIAAQARTIGLLQQDAVQAYVGGGPEVALNASLPPTDLNQALLREELEQTFASQQTDALDGYRLAADNAALARERLAAARDAAARVLAGIARARQQVQASQDKLVALERQVNGQIAALVAEIERQRLLAERRAEQALLARERAAAAAAARAEAAARARAEAKARAEAAARAQAEAKAAAEARAAAERLAAERKVAASSLGALAGKVSAAAASPTAATTTTAAPAGESSYASSPQIPGVSPAASIAVAAAESRVGDPYVWGAAGPDAFDCSGLIMWAYEQAGVYLPHYSGAQYADTIHIPMSDLEPGDLVFPADPGQHVAMYVGNGEIVQAPYTGADVQIIPLSPFFVLASRVG
jgi:cell wall-associated NlpC family hydrolase